MEEIVRKLQESMPFNGARIGEAWQDIRLKRAQRETDAQTIIDRLPTAKEIGTVLAGNDARHNGFPKLTKEQQTAISGVLEKWLMNRMVTGTI